MNKVYGFLLTVVLLGLAFAADLLTYATLGGDFFIFGVFVLGTLFVFGVFLFGTWLGTLFSLVMFSITLLTGIISFRALFGVNEALLGLLLVVGIFGFVGSLLCAECKKKCSKSSCGSSAMNPDAPPMPMPLPVFASKRAKQNAGVSTYDVESPELQSLAMMESLDDFKNAGNDEDFVELQD
ncbi:MAG: hypothetical protein AABX82_07385, partial [Nanoarchaeota archaeon]